MNKFLIGFITFIKNRGVNKGKCIDDALISRLIGEKIKIKKDPNQRESCSCVQSI